MSFNLETWLNEQRKALKAVNDNKDAFEVAIENLAAVNLQMEAEIEKLKGIQSQIDELHETLEKLEKAYETAAISQNS